ncbi:hypothetical protein PHBOTO_004225 [Pseudozyma hubeiensis]|nr:hypothetical protein PHBOTO_004225 [Pseudozyma hubeiensis]
MSDDPSRNMTPVAARSSIVPSESITLRTLPPTSHFSSGHRKLRLRIITRHPLPEHHFLAPFDPNDSQCFAKLKHFVHAHLMARSKGVGQSEVMENIAQDALEFQMDSFEVPNDPEILRDGDTVEVVVDPESAMQASRNGEIVMTQSEADESDEDDTQDEADDDDDSNSHELSAADAEERDALLEAKRLAALLRSGIHKSSDDQHDDLPSRLHAEADDLPRMPRQSSLNSVPALKTIRPTASKTSNPERVSFPTLPLMPTSLALGGGAASAMAAFEAKRKQMQASSSSAQSRPPPPMTPARGATASGSKRNLRRDRSSSSSSSSSSRDSSSESDSDSDSDSNSNSTDSSSESESESDSASSDSDSQTSDGSSDSAPSVQATHSDRPRQVINASSQRPKSPAPVPPGQGLNRTKRRNAMRRMKVKEQREAQNTLRFLEARERAASREDGSGHVGEADRVGWVEDREPALLQVEGISAHAQSNGVNLSSDGDMPPGGGSFGMEESTITSAEQPIETRKRKRTDETAATIESNNTPVQRLGPRWQDMRPGQAPYGGVVPANVQIRHIDCQAFYDDQLARMEAEAEDAPDMPFEQHEEEPIEERREEQEAAQSEEQVEEEVNALSEVQEPRRRRSERIRGILSQRQQESEDAADADRARKRIKIEEVTPALGTPVPVDGPNDIRFSPKDPPGDDEDFDIDEIWQELVLGDYHPSDIALSERVHAPVVPWSDLRPGIGILWQELALHPERNTPEMLWHAGVVSTCRPLDAEGRRRTQVEAMGPFEENKWRHYEDYDSPYREHWATEEEYPALVYRFG